MISASVKTVTITMNFKTIHTMMTTNDIFILCRTSGASRESGSITPEMTVKTWKNESVSGSRTFENYES